MYVERIDNYRYRVVNHGEEHIMTLDEVMYLLSQPPAEYPVYVQDSLEEFWDSKPIYPKED